MEFRGFSAMAESLEFEIVDIGISAARIRAATIDVVHRAVSDCTRPGDTSNEMHLGGDIRRALRRQWLL